MSGIGNIGGALGKEFRGTFSVLNDVFSEKKKGGGEEEAKKSSIDELRSRLKDAQDKIKELTSGGIPFVGGQPNPAVSPLTTGVSAGDDANRAAQQQLKQTASSGAKSTTDVNIKPTPMPSEAMGGPVAMTTPRGSTRVTVSADQIAAMRLQHEVNMVG